jgi:diaminohydroxyphosphoribosylaminopyrimidine deaminase/5-amino-6-(5-phosphoribosylamino)uracil reductase
MHKKFIKISVNEAYKNLGKTFPNPSVGAVLVDKNGVLIKKSVTAINGSPHAERNLLAGLSLQQTKDTTLYVTLEPCSHYGRNPPCIDLIIKAKIAHIVIGILDQNKLVNGIKVLKENNIKVTILNDVDAIELHKYFNYFITNKLPYITAKMAVTLDGKIALANGDSKWITNIYSRNLVHLLRSQHDAIMTSIGTVLADDPQLNCRVSGYYQEKNIILIDPKLDVSMQANIVKNCVKSPLWIIVNKDVNNKKIKELERLGVKIFQFDAYDIKHNFVKILSFLAEQNITAIFCEAGGFITKLYKQNLLNELLLFRANKVFGNNALDMFQDLGGLEDLSLQKNKKHIDVLEHKELYDGDMLTKFIFR